MWVHIFQRLTVDVFSVHRQAARLRGAVFDTETRRMEVGLQMRAAEPLVAAAEAHGYSLWYRI